MHDYFTPGQQKQLQVWAEQRDALLKDIGTFSVERDTKKQEADVEAQRLTDIHRSISEAEGRISVLERLEDVKKNSISSDLSELIARKSRLEGEIGEQETKLVSLKEKYQITLSATSALCDAGGVIEDQSQAITTILSQIKTTSIEHLGEAKEVLANIKTVADTVLDRANENLAQSKIVIEKMPKFIFDMQRPIPVRRTYPVGHPNAHRNETSANLN